jgi:WD40 repeat protein
LRRRRPIVDAREKALSARDEKVFVSYAREDLSFVARLSTALENSRFDVWVDTEGLYAGEEFWDRICAEIDRATAVVCVVSKNFARSEFCRREAEHAANRGKRILPVVVDAVAARELPEPIRVRHWLSFGGSVSFEQSVSALARSVRQDPGWIHQHTWLFVRAVEWAERDRDTSLCLRGRELDDAIAWLAGAEGREPPVHALHIEFIDASRKEDADVRERTERLSRISRSRALTSRAELLRSSPSTSTLMPALLAAHAFYEHRSPEAYEVLWRSLRYLPRCRPRLDHPYCVGAVCFSPDGRLLATAAGMSREDEWQREVVRSARGPSLEDVDEDTPGMRRLSAEGDHRNTDAFEAFVWDSASGELLARLPHRGRVRGLAFLPDGVRLMTACEDGDATVWSVHDGQRLASFGHSGPSCFVAVSSDGYRALTVADDDPTGLGQLNAHMWSIADGCETLRLSLGGMDKGAFLRRELTSFDACPRLERLAAAFVDGSVKVLSLVDGAVISTGDGESYVHAVRFTSDGRYLAIGEVSQARIVSADDCREVVVLPHPGAVELVRWIPRGDRLVTVSDDANGLRADIAVWQFDGVREASFGSVSVSEVAVSADGSVVAAGGQPHAVSVWSLGGEGSVAGELHFEGSVNAVAFSPDGTRIAAGSDDLSARVWDAQFGLNLVETDLDDTDRIVALSHDARYVAVAGSTACRILEVATGEWVGDTETDEYINIVRWSPDGSKIAIASSGGVTLWHWASDAHLTLEHEHVRALGFGPDGAYLVTAGTAEPRRSELVAGAGRIWRTADGYLASEVRHSDTAVACAAHPDGVTFATAAGPYYGHGIVISRADGGADVWIEYAEPANGLAFSSDGKVLVVGYHELGVELFNTRTGRYLSDVGRFREVRAVAFDPHGRFLAVTENREVYHGPKVVTTEVFRWDSISDGKPVAVLSGESLLTFPQGSSFLATQDDASTRIRDTATWELVCSFPGAVAQTAAFRNHLMARLESTGSTTQLSLSRWTPDDLAAEIPRRLPRDLSEAQWRECMGGSEPFRPLLDRP